MLVCHCFAVTDREIARTVRAGACSLEEIAECCGAGSGCGGCVEMVEQILHDEHRHLHVVNTAPHPHPHGAPHSHPQAVSEVPPAPTGDDAELALTG